MVNPLLFGLVLLTKLDQSLLVNAALPTTHVSQESNVTSATHNTSDTLSSSLIATANVSGAFNVTGHFQFALLNGSGPIAVSLELTGLNALGSSLMYSYHIHTNPISPDGNCSSAFGHLDPLDVTEALNCSPQMAQFCQEGDMAGRSGKLNATEAITKVSYVDNYLRFWPQPFSILGRSVVVHLPNSTRIACGNITSVVDGTAGPDGMPTFRSSNYTTKYPSSPPPAVPVKYTPFIGSTPNDTALALITLPSPLPTVQELPNIILGSNGTAGSKDPKAASAPAAINASSSFSYVPGAVLPSQDILSVNGTTSSENGAKKGANSGVGTFAPSILFINIIGLGFIISS